MKKSAKILTLGISAVLILTTIASCNRRKEFEELYESQQKASETATTAAETNILEVETGEEEYKGPFPSTAGYKLNHIKKEGDKGYYEGKSKDEIKAMFNPAPGEYDFSNANVNTPLGFIIWTVSGHHAFYNKQTGNVSQVCPDPLCDPVYDDCIWAHHSGYVYVSKDHIYFVQNEYATQDRSNYALYRSDPERNNVERLYVFDSKPDIYYIDGDSIYLCFYRYREGAPSISTFSRLDIVKTATSTECNVTYLSPNKESVEISAVVGGKVYFRYSDSKDKSWYDLYVTDLRFKTPTLAFQNSLISGYTEQYLILSEWVDFGKQAPYTLYNMDTGERRDVTELFNTFGDFAESGNYIYYEKKLTEEEINASPLKDYYLYTVTETRGEQSREVYTNSRTGGRLFRMNLDTLEEECVFHLTYNDIPVEISSYKIDGNLCYIEYGDYEHFMNYYNQEDEWEHSYPWPRQHAVIDFSNGTINIFTLEGIDVGIDSIQPGP